MGREISYNEAGRSTDLQTLIEYCKQGVLENNDMNQRTFADWKDGAHIVDTYLDHNDHLTGALYGQVVEAVGDWLQDQKEQTD